ncbi:MAG: D-alanyl-D-alanine carboxypeptidase, partial [Alistipes sp.]|nr:D-alanyl-D-alanine carboxypeptidase [Alistipes sp.]
MRKKRFIFILILSLVLSSTRITYAANNTGSTEAETTQGSEEPAASAEPETDESGVDGTWPEPPAISAGSAILLDADTGTVLYDKDSHIKGFPASVTKLMTALLTVENCSLSETVTISRNAEYSVGPEDAKLDIHEGETFTVEEALYALMLKSANDIAFALGEHIAGSVPEFASMMNSRAAQLGALNTHFTNASGLSDPDHYTTAYDIAMFSRACMNNSTITEIMQTRQYVIQPTNKYGYTRTLNQRHEMLMKNSSHYYEYAIGGKTGFTDESKYTLCTFASKGDMNLIAVVLLCESPDDRYTDTTALFEYGFNNFEKLTLDSADTSNLLADTGYYHSNVFSGSNVTFSLASSAVTVPKGVTSSDITMLISRNNTAGEAFATVQFQYGDVIVGNSELTMSTVSKAAATNKPTNLPFLAEKEAKPVEVKEYIVINAIHIIYSVV